MKGNKSFFRICCFNALLLMLVSCNSTPQTTYSTSNTTSSTPPTSPSENSTTTTSTSTSDQGGNKEDFSIPEVKDYTQFYLKNSLANLQRGQTIDLNQYIGVLPGKKDTNPSTTLTASVLNGETTTSAGYIQEGNGAGAHLVISKPGEIIFNVQANGVTKTYDVLAKEGLFMSNLLDALKGVGVNYAMDSYSIDTTTGDRTFRTHSLRGVNYIYNETQKYGYLLSKKDDQMYSFKLDSATSTNLEVEVPPVSDKLNYNLLFAPLSNFSSANLWSFSTLFENNVMLKKYNVAFMGSSQEIIQFFYSLNYLQQSYTINNTTFTPAAVFASYQNKELSFLPVISDGSNIVYLPEVVLSKVDEASVPVLESYVSEYKSPVKADVTELVNNVRHLTDVFDYTVSAKTTAYDSKGEEVPRYSPYMKSVFHGMLWEPYHYVTEPAFFDDNFHGFYPEVLGGGLFNKDKKTYEFLDEDGDGKYESLTEYIEYGHTTSSEVWWGYSFINIYLAGWGYPISDIKNGYPSYDAASGTYTFSGVTTGGYDLLAGGIAFGYTKNILNNNEYVKTVLKSSYATSKFNFTYNAKGVLSKMVNTIEITFPKSVFPVLDQDYRWKCEITIDDIGGTWKKMKSIVDTVDPTIFENYKGGDAA